MSLKIGINNFRYILPGTTIVSDRWTAYRNINVLGGGVYEHLVVIHQENFVDPNDPRIHTQNVENLWMRAKRKLKRQFGTSPNLFGSYLQEFMWRNKISGEPEFPNFLKCIVEQYPMQ